MGLIANDHSDKSITNELAEERNEMIRHFKTWLDDYLQFYLIAAAYAGCFWCKIKERLLEPSAIFFKGEVLALGTATV